LGGCDASGVRVMSAGTAGAIASAYGLGVLARDPVYATRGEQGLIWRLDTRGGSWAVKELLLPVAEAGAARDVEFQLAAWAAGIPLPLPRRARDGRVVLPAEEAGSAWSVRVYRWADVCGGQAVTGAEIGAVTARVHQVQHAGPGPAEAWFSEPVGEPAWQALLGDACRGEAGWAGALGRRLPGLIAVDAAVAPPEPGLLRTCHRDLNTENILRAVSGGVTVLDWENSGPAQPERELAAIVSGLAADAGTQAARTAYAAYQAAGGPARLSGPADFATAIAVQGHLLQFYGRRALDRAESAENRARSRKRLDQILSQPLTTSRIDRLLGLLTK
jgi:aminoglycoside phosphotransferase (APT) family kinase protein